jgi:predicted transcriptional regulator
MKNITFRADASLIHQARVKALAEKTTLSKLFKEWLKNYVSTDSTKLSLDEVMKRLSYADAGRSFTRDEKNEH